MERRCIHCNAVIPEGRLEALPDTNCCVQCSNESPRIVEVAGTDPEDLLQVVEGQ